MCWYSADHADQILQAEAGQRLGIRKVHGCSWAVRESDLHTPKPIPVCLIDRTTVLFRFPELEQAASHAAPEAKALLKENRAEALITEATSERLSMLENVLQLF